MDVEAPGYRIASRLGSGGLSEVYLGTRERDGLQVAIKVLVDAAPSGPNLRRFLREGHLLRRLAHPALPRCLDVQEEPQPFIVLEYLDGETLSRRLRTRGALSAETVERLVVALLDVLAYLHERGIVHRDVKSGNVFLCTDGRVVLLDLGLAADPRDPFTTTLGDVMGTYAYMAPEQIAGGEADGRADLYALGITLYEALAGRRPYRAKGARGYLEAHRAGRHPPLDQVCPTPPPARLVRLVERLMARDPGDRPPSAAAALAEYQGRGLPPRTLSTPPLVGRDAAIGAIEAVLEHGGILQVHGEPGMGTGRLAREALRLAGARGIDLLAVRCGRSSTVEAIDRQLVRELAPILGRVLPPADVAGELGHLAGEGGFALLVQDLAEAPAPLRVAMVDRLADLSMPRILVGVEPVAELGGHLLELRSLESWETERLVGGMLGTTAPPDELVEQLHRVTRGLPGAVVALLRDMVEQDELVAVGVAEDGARIWRLQAVPGVRGHRSVAELYLRRLEGLGFRARRVLELLAVAGEDLPREVLLRAARLAGPALEIERLEAMRLVRVRRTPDGDLVGLRRPVLADLLVEGLNPQQERSLHQALVGALRPEADRPEVGERLAWHRTFVARPGQRARALVGLGTRCGERGRYVQALVAVGRAFQETGLEPVDAAHGALTRGRALLALGRQAEAVEAYAAARRLAEEIDRDDLVALAIDGLSELRLLFGDARRCLALLDQLEDFPASAEPALRWRLVVRRCRAAIATARWLEAEATLERLEAEADRPERQVEPGWLRGRLLAARGRALEALPLLQAATEALLGMQRPVDASEAAVELARRLGQLGRLQEALQWLDRADEFGDRWSLPGARRLARTARAELLVAVGDLDAAHDLLQRHRGLADPGQRVDHGLLWWGARTALELARGDRAAALSACHAAAGRAERSGRVPQAAYYKGLEAVLTGRPGMLDRCLEELLELGDRRALAHLLMMGATVGAAPDIVGAALDEARASGDPLLWLTCLHASGTEADRARAQRLVERLRGEVPPSLLPAFERHPAVRWCRQTRPVRPG